MTSSIAAQHSCKASPVKCLIVVENLGAGGAELQILLLLPKLVAEGISFEIAVLWPPYSLAKNFETLGVTVHRLDLTHRWALLQGFKLLRSLTISGRFQYIWSPLYFGHLYSAILRATRPNLRLVLWLQSPGYMNSLYCGIWPTIRAHIHGWAIRKADRVIACSKAVAKDYELSFRLPPLDVIYNAIPDESLPGPLSLAEREDIRKKYGIPRNAPLLTIGARYSIEKGHTYLLDAISILEQTAGIQAYCIAAGQGALKTELEQQAYMLGLEKRVIFIGFLDQRALHQIIQSSDLVVLPSLQEAWGLAAVEAMAIGTATVVTDYYGLAEVAAEGSAFTALPRDSQSLASAIHLALTDELSRKKVIGIAHQRVEKNWTVNNIARQWMKVLG